MDAREQVLRYVRVSEFGPPCTVQQLLAAERQLGQRLPDILRTLYLRFDGFSGTAGLPLFWPLLSPDGLVEFNLFFRRQSYAPSWAKDAVFFGSDGIGGSAGLMWGIRTATPSEIIEWGFQDGEDWRTTGNDLFQVWGRYQREYDEDIRTSEPGQSS